MVERRHGFNWINQVDDVCFYLTSRMLLMYTLDVWTRSLFTDCAEATGWDDAAELCVRTKVRETTMKSQRVVCWLQRRSSSILASKHNYCAAGGKGWAVCPQAIIHYGIMVMLVHAPTEWQWGWIWRKCKSCLLSHQRTEMWYPVETNTYAQMSK